MAASLGVAWSVIVCGPAIVYFAVLLKFSDPTVTGISVEIVLGAEMAPPNTAGMLTPLGTPLIQFPARDQLPLALTFHAEAALYSSRRLSAWSATQRVPAGPNARLMG